MLAASTTRATLKVVVSDLNDQKHAYGAEGLRSTESSSERLNIMIQIQTCSDCNSLMVHVFCSFGTTIMRVDLKYIYQFEVDSFLWGVAYIEGSQTLANAFVCFVKLGRFEMVFHGPWVNPLKDALNIFELLGITRRWVLVALVMGLAVIDNLSTRAHWEMLMQRPERWMKLLMLEFARFN